MSGARERLDSIPSLKHAVQKKKVAVFMYCVLYYGERWVDETSVVSSKFNQCFDYCHSSCGFYTKMFQKLVLFSSLGVNVEEGSYSDGPFFKAGLYQPLL